MARYNQNIKRAISTKKQSKGKWIIKKTGLANCTADLKVG
jgi:hypothetical protein